MNPNQAELRSVPVKNPLLTPPSVVSTNFTTLVPAPNISKIDVGDDSVEFTWDKSPYKRIAYKLVDFENWTSNKTMSESDNLPMMAADFDTWIMIETMERSYKVTGLRPNSQYLLQVIFVVKDIKSEIAYIDVETKSAADAIKIVNPSISAITFNSATVVWDNEGNIADGYIVQYGPTGAGKENVKQLSLSYYDDTIADMVELDEDTEYLVSIIPIVEGGKSEASQLTFHTGLGPPRNVSVPYTSSNEVIITWEEASASVSDYRVQYWKEDIQSFSPEFNSQDIKEIFIKGLSATISGLEPDSDYHFQVSAKQTVTNKFTEATSTRQHTLPDSVSRLRIQKSHNNWIRVGWDAPTVRVDKFVALVLDEDKNVISKHNIPNTKTILRIDELAAASWYRVEMTAVSAGRVSPKRSILAHTELNMPTAVELVNATETSTVVQWDPKDCRTIVHLMNLSNLRLKLFTAPLDTNQVLIAPLTPGTEYNIKVQHTKNNIISEFVEKKFVTSISMPTPAINIAYLTDYNALFNWNDSDISGNIQYLFQWRKKGQA